MEAIDRLTASYQAMSQRLDASELEPAPEREDWRERIAEISELCQEYESEMLANIHEAAAEVDGETAAALQTAVAVVGGELAALLHASGKSGDALLLLSKVVAISSDTASAELAAAQADMANYVRLIHGRWLLRRGDRDAASEVLEPIVADCREPILVKAAKSELDAPKPLRRAPSLFTWNGFGLGMSGARDARGDTHVSTHCLTALWLPVLPLSAYRIADHGDGSYTFYSKEKLSRFAVWYRRLALTSVVALIVGLFISARLNDPNRLARKAIDRASASARAGKRDEAIRRYEKVLDDYGHKAGRSALGRAGTALVALYADQLPKPLAADDVPKAENVIRRYEKLPDKARSPASQQLLAKRVITWVDELGAESVSAMLAATRLLDTAEDSAGVAVDLLRGRRKVLQNALAGRVASDWPMAAVAIYLDLDELAAAGDVLVRVAAHPSLLEASEHQVRAWLDRADRNSALLQKANTVRDALGAAKKAAADPARAKILAGENKKALRAWVNKHPRDQRAAVALATARLRAGDAAGARTLLAAIGKPGWLIPEAREVLSQAYLQDGELERAEELLAQVLQLRLPRFLRASKRYNDAASAAHKRLLSRAQAGQVPADVRSKLSGPDEGAAREAFQAWASAEMERDANLAALKTEYVAYSDVVSLSIALGTVKLQRANQVQGADRKALLAQAERAFLAIRQDAAGLPSYHLGLGQVYHRLGRPEEGDKELEGLLKRKEPTLDLEVARAYRELGIPSRARSILKALHERASKKEHRYAAAGMLAVMAEDLDEQEAWLEKSDPKSPYIRINLLELEARKHYRAARYIQADAVLAKVVKRQEAEAKHNEVAANNVAISYRLRYLCTGKRSHLRRAIALLESSRRMRPDNALVVGNLASSLQLVGSLEVLDKLVRVDALRLDAGDVSKVIGALLEGPRADVLREAVKSNPTLSRAAQLQKQHAVLAPNQAHSYVELVHRYRWLRDTAALRALRDALKARTSTFDWTDANRELAAYLAGERDAKLLEAAKRSLVHAAARMARASATHHEPTLGVARYLHASALGDLVGETGTLADATKTVEAFEQAHRTWAALGAEQQVANTQVLVAVFKAKASSPAMAKRWEAERRKFGLTLFLHRLASTPSSAPLLSALRKQPELGKAARMFASSEHAPTLLHWAVAEASGDAELMRKAKTVFALEHMRLYAELAAQLAPPDSQLTGLKALFDANR